MSCRSRIFMVFSFRLFSYETCWANNSSLGATIDKKQNLFQRLISIKFSVGKSLFLKKSNICIYVRGLSFQYLGNKNSGETKNSEKVI